MTTYNLPSVGIKAVRFALVTNSMTFTSPYNNSTQVAALPGAYWEATYTCQPYHENDDEADEIKAFLLKLSGRVNTFNAYDPSRRTPKGIATGTPLVKGAGQTGRSLLVDGFTPDTTGIMKMGDYYSVNNELKRLTATSNSNGSGEATLLFEPPLRSSPADNAAITISSPTCLMRLIDDNQADFVTDESLFWNHTFSARETFI